MEDRLTQRALYGTVYKELLATATPGREPRQALRIPVLILEGLEFTVMDQTSVFHLRVYAWWVLLQCWATLRFSDHRGLNPGRDFLVEGNKLVAKLTRSKTIGEDKKLRYRMVLTTECCFVSQPNWFSVGWALLKEKADFRRDYLLPSPTTNYRGCVQRELQYETASATQTKLFSNLTVAGERLFQHRVASYWTPHSARNFSPECSVRFERVEVRPRSIGRMDCPTKRQVLESVEEPDRSCATSGFSKVSRTILTMTSLAETEALEDFISYLSGRGLSKEATQRYSRLLSHRRFVERRHEHERPAVETSPEQHEEQELEFSEGEEGTKQGPGTRQRGKPTSLERGEDEETRRSIGDRHKSSTRTHQVVTGTRVLCGSITEAKTLHPPPPGILLHVARSRLPGIGVPRNIDAEPLPFRADLQKVCKVWYYSP